MKTIEQCEVELSKAYDLLSEKQKKIVSDKVIRIFIEEGRFTENRFHFGVNGESPNSSSKGYYTAKEAFEAGIGYALTRFRY